MGIQVFSPKYEVEECLDEIRECLEIGWTGMGFKTDKFEEEWIKYTGLNNAYFTNSATSALNMAVGTLKAFYDWDSEDEIITTPFTFVSTNHAILKNNMKAVFADIDDTMCLDPNSVREKINENTKAIMYVGIGGNIGNYYEIIDICREHNLKMILDASHMAGTRVGGIIPGTEAEVVIYSFQAVKNLPTGDSGMLCFKNKELDQIARKYGWLGINKNTYERSANQGNYKWKYDVEYLGEKYHGNSIMASLGLVQLKYLDRDNEYRRQIAKWYKESLNDVDGIRYVRIPEDCISSTHLFQIIVENRDGLLTFLNEKGINPGVHYQENTIYSMYSYAQGTCPNAEYYSAHVLTLPIHLRLKEEDVAFISEAIKEFLNKEEEERDI